jgi:hypothetical protein
MNQSRMNASNGTRLWQGRRRGGQEVVYALILADLTGIVRESAACHFPDTVLRPKLEKSAITVK